MARYQTVLFDLDGTLTDPALGITNAVMYALQKMGRPVPPRQALYRYIGPPLLDSFQQYAGMTDAEARRALALYREYFAPTGIFENEVYPGIPQLLKELRAAGCGVVLATSKPEPFARQILEHFGLAEHFTLVVGATMDETRTEKHEVIAYALQLLGMPAKDTVIMVGDRSYDVQGAAHNGLGCIGVLYGFGSRQELTDAGAAALASDVPALRRFLLA